MSLRAALADDAKFNEVAQKAFDQADTDKSGSISVTELRAVLTQMAELLGTEIADPSKVEETFATLDVNKDGKLSLEELKVLVRQLLEKLVDIFEPIQ